MKLKIPEYKYEQVLVTDNEYEFPDTESYWFETGIRRSIRIVPKWTTWQKEQGKEEEIWKYDITCVYLSFECIIEKFDISIKDITDNRVEKEYERLVNSIKNGWLSPRTKEQFEADLNNAIDEINKI